ncbi:MAG: hypothetical protein JNM07_06160 [Phycisphaerae bacterium]|nr:hypothetical protein [Phycisphaerae bacterium]
MRSLIAALTGVCLTILYGGSPAARAQENPESVSPAQAAAPAPPMGTGEVSVGVVQFGVGGKCRPGDWFGVQVEVAQRSDAFREVVIRLDVPDADGDSAWYERVIVPNPGVKQRTWLYGRLPSRFDGNSVVTISAHAAIEAKANDTSSVGAGTRPSRFSAGKLIGGVQHRLAGAIPSTSGILAVIGRQTMGLELLGVRGNAVTTEHLATGHELTELVAGLRPADLPDRWMGLAPFECIVWSASGGDGEPADLSEAQAEAVREWVRRGGHLIAVLPPAGQAWTNPTGNPLRSIMPVVGVTRVEGVPPDRYRKLLNRDSNLVLPGMGVLHVFQRLPEANAQDARVVLKDAEDECVVVRRATGVGAVTLIGLDLTGRSLNAARAIEPDVFWNRVLGRRGELKTADELAKLRQTTGAFFDGRVPIRLDEGLRGEIAKQARAAAGVLLAFGVFAVYWLVAGPLGYSALRRRGLKQHSWLWFVLSAAVFTGVAWGGASMLKPRRVEVQHLTVLDHVYGQPTERARAWMSVLLPRYGEQRIDIAPEPGGEVSWHNALASWELELGGASGPSAGVGSYADARGYSVDSRQPDSMTVPARSTVKQIQADWAGGPIWKTVRPATNAEAGVGHEIALIERESRAADERSWEIHGSIVHDLPGPLEDVTLVLVRRQARLHAPAAVLPVEASAVKLPDPWRPGEPMVIDAQFGRRASQITGLAEYLASLAAAPDDPYAPRPQRDPDRPSRDLAARLSAMTFFSLLEPPDYRDTRSDPLARRQATHGLDLSLWASQPCLIVLGHITDRPGPVPIRVDGAECESRGRTFVRWVYPLDAPAPDAR